MSPFIEFAEYIIVSKEYLEKFLILVTPRELAQEL